MLDLMCYNQKRDFQCWIPRNQNDSEQLAKLIRASGLSGGLKAYFKAFVDQATKQLVSCPQCCQLSPGDGYVTIGADPMQSSAELVNRIGFQYYSDATP